MQRVFVDWMQAEDHYGFEEGQFQWSDTCGRQIERDRGRGRFEGGDLTWSG